MSTDYVALAKELTQLVGKLNKAQPEMMAGFQKMSQSATAPGALDAKTKELIALGLAVAARCEGCIAFHVQKLVKLGVTDQEFHETLAMAVYMGGGPSLMYAAESIRAYEQFTK